MVLIVTVGACASLFAPLIVLYSQPIPFVTLSAFLLIAIVCSCVLSRQRSQERDVETEERLLANWHNTSGLKHDVSLLNTTQRQNAEQSFVFYGTRDGYVQALNNSYTGLAISQVHHRNNSII